MRKLRLIRPWRLQAVRQKAAYGQHTIPNYPIERVSCKGPQANDEAAVSVNAGYPTHEKTAMAAPVSGVIFATGNNPRW